MCHRFGSGLQVYTAKSPLGPWTDEKTDVNQRVKLSGKHVSVVNHVGFFLSILTRPLCRSSPHKPTTFSRLMENSSTPEISGPARRTGSRVTTSSTGASSSSTMRARCKSWSLWTSCVCSIKNSRVLVRKQVRKQFILRHVFPLRYP